MMEMHQIQCVLFKIMQAKFFIQMDVKSPSIELSINILYSAVLN